MKCNSDNNLVYSSEKGRIKPLCTGKKLDSKKADGMVRLGREVKGRGGGTVITISGVPLPAASLKNLAGELKKKCGCGGTTKNGIIEIQGDHRDALMLELQARGFKVKLGGG